MPKIGVIAGSGLYDMEGFDIVEERSVDTPYGTPSAAYRVGRFHGGPDVVFLPRHGVPHSLPPHRVNYRANLHGFSVLGVENLISISAVGGISPDLRSGDIVPLQQIIDRTSGRDNSFFDGPDVVHIDFTEPYCRRLRGLLRDTASTHDVRLAAGATYVCTNGPRLETAAEIRMFRRLGADVVGMTAMPEAALARERGICLLGLSIVTNPAAGMEDRTLTTDEVVANMQAASERLRHLLRILLPAVTASPRGCRCARALDASRL